MFFVTVYCTQIQCNKSCCICNHKIKELKFEFGYKIESHIILAVLRRSVIRVGGAHFRIIAPAGNTALFKEMLQRWRAVGNTASELTFHTSRSRDEYTNARPTDRSRRTFSMACSILACSNFSFRRPHTKAAFLFANLKTA